MTKASVRSLKARYRGFCQDACQVSFDVTKYDKREEMHIAIDIGRAA